jgi:curved DNA-binding protein CbpA
MKPFSQQSYYELLEVPFSASEDQIRAAYASASELYAPDSIAVYSLSDPAQAELLRSKLQTALAILTDPELRLDYDRSIGLAPPPEEEDEDAAKVPSLAEETEQLSMADLLTSAEKRPFLRAAGPDSGVSRPVDPTRVPAAAFEGTPEQGAAPVAADGNGPLASKEGTAPRDEEKVVSPSDSSSEERPGEAASEEGSRQASSERAEGAPAEEGRAGRDDEDAASPPEMVEADEDREQDTAKVITRDEHGRPLDGASPAAASTVLEGDGEVSEPRPGSRSGSRSLEQAPHLAEESGIANAETAMAHVVSVTNRDQRPRSVEIGTEAVINGELLRGVRKSKGMSLAHLSERTRIAMRHLENIEADRYDGLPANVYLRGMLMSLSRELGLDPVRIAKGYLDCVIEKQKGR